MRIQIGYELIFHAPAPTPMLLLLYVRPERIADLEQPERLTIEPFAPVSVYTDSFGNMVGRVVMPAGRVRFHYDNICRDPGRLDALPEHAIQHDVADLPAEVLRFLLASRYCEVDRMSELAWQLFGQTAPGWPRVKAICSWVHQHVTFGYQYARPTKTAYDVYVEKQGVCRDFMHLAITLLRAMNIPARYATGYFGDIGVPPDPNPMDFSAWLEVHLGGQWWTLDARHNEPRIGRILMAYGRDAVDAALTTSFGMTTLESFRVWTEEVK